MVWASRSAILLTVVVDVLRYPLYRFYERSVTVFFFSSRRRHTIFKCDWSSDVCSSDLDCPTTSSIGCSLNVKAQPIEEVVGQSLTLQRFTARLTGFFAGLGLLLASIGVYGIMSYVAAQRTGEMGIRMALGARPGVLLWLVMRESRTPVRAGIVVD